MRSSLKVTLVLLLLLALSSLACGGSFSTANIKDAFMSRDDAGQQDTLSLHDALPIYRKSVV